MHFSWTPTVVALKIRFDERGTRIMTETAVTRVTLTLNSTQQMAKPLTACYNAEEPQQSVTPWMDLSTGTEGGGELQKDATTIPACSQQLLRAMHRAALTCAPRSSSLAWR